MSATLPCIDYGTVSRLQQTPAPTPTAPRWTANFDTSACVLATNGFVEVFDRREPFRLNGVPLKRGIILQGAPGTGKTLLGKVLAGLKLATFVYVTAADISGLESVRSIFDLARRLGPTVLFFEDIDLFTDDRSSYCSKAMLGEILARLDGFETNDGLIHRYDERPGGDRPGNSRAAQPLRRRHSHRAFVAFRPAGNSREKFAFHQRR